MNQAKTCPHCGREMDADQLERGVCDSDDCPRHSKDLTGKRAIFNYPAAFVTLPEYTAHSGQTVTIVRPLIAGEEYDDEGDPMYEVRADDGWTGHAWESELEITQ